jgi:hypothetical protein
MTFIEALKYMSEGKKIRSKYWLEKKYYFELNGEGRLVDQDGRRVLDFGSLTKNDWEIFEEKPKTKQVWLWAYRYKYDDPWMIYDELRAEFETNSSGYEKIKIAGPFEVPE